MPFLTDLVTSDDEKSGNKSVLLADLVYQLIPDNPTVLVVPKGFVTDYASIPRVIQLLIPKLGRHRKAAVLHDYLYAKDCDYQSLLQAECDSVFLSAMKGSGVSKWKRCSLYSGVRVGGWASFRKKNAEFRS